MSELKTGVGRVDITPPIGIRMQGYAARTHGAIGIHDRLEATAIAFDDGSNRIAIVTCDLVGLDRISVRKSRRIASEICGIDPNAVMISCSHTHGGPAIGRRSYVEAEKQYLHILERQIATSVALAVGDLRNSKIFVGKGSINIGVNRRLLTETGMVIGVNPDGPIDPDVAVLRIDDESGKTRALLFSHSCHGTTLGGDNYQITADYVGYARRTIEGALREDGTISSFVNGAAGNINPHPRGTYELARAHGIALAGEAIRTSQAAQEAEEPAILHHEVETVLPLSEPPPLEEIEAGLRDLQKELQSKESKGIHAPGPRAQVLWREEMRRRIQKGSVKDGIRVRIQAVRIGPMAIVGIPGEVFVEIGRGIKEESPFAHNIVAGYTNGSFGYIPTAQAFEEGGYEPNSHVYLLEQKFSPNVGEIARKASMDALRALASEGA
jgi:neutral ceramidase